MIVNVRHILFCWRPLWCAVLLMMGCAEYTAYRHLDAALRHESRGDSEAALTAFEAAVAARSDDAYLRRRLGWAYAQRSMYDDARAELEAALALEPAYLPVFRDLAAVSEAQSMPDVAVGWLERSIEAAPAYVPSYRDLAATYLAQDRLSESQALLEEVVERWPDAAWAHFRLGELFVRLKWSEQAALAFEKVVDLKPHTKADYALFVKAHGVLGNVYFEQENYDSAAVFYGKAIELNPADHSALNNLAWLFAVQGTRLEEGVRLSQRSLQLNPQSPTYMDTLAELYYKLGDVDQATRIIQQAIALEPEDSELKAHLNRQLAKFRSRGQGKV